MSSHWWSGGLDRRAARRAEYRRTGPALLEFEGLRCAVRDLGTGGLRIEPAPPGRVWTLGLMVEAEIQLRASGRLPISGRIMRIDRAGMAILPDGTAWPTEDAVATERALLLRGSRERRAAPRLPVPVTIDVTTPLRDVSTSGLRYLVGPRELSPAVGEAIAGAVRLDAETVIDIRGHVVRRMGHEVAIALDPPGLDPDVLALLRRRFFPGAGSAPAS
jgi:PilZ domain-containing protein